ncbi:hypothetical protein GCM10010422_29200 [Streptomyces graminearus]|uniref:Uncharacterized protein n=1 Tax=Streptomyces graminearus TaxID=284030 RepID=A0ABP5YMV7_9ACTN
MPDPFAGSWGSRGGVIRRSTWVLSAGCSGVRAPGTCGLPAPVGLPVPPRSAVPSPSAAVAAPLSVRASRAACRARAMEAVRSWGAGTERRAASAVAAPESRVAPRSPAEVSSPAPWALPGPRVSSAPRAFPAAPGFPALPEPSDRDASDSPVVRSDPSGRSARSARSGLPVFPGPSGFGAASAVSGSSSLPGSSVSFTRPAPSDGVAGDPGVGVPGLAAGSGLSGATPSFGCCGCGSSLMSCTDSCFASYVPVRLVRLLRPPLKTLAPGVPFPDSGTLRPQNAWQAAGPPD